MSLGIIDYKFCGYGTAVSKVGDSTLYEMSKRNPWVWGALRNELYYCYVTDPTTCQQIAVHVPPVPAIIRQFNLTMEEVVSTSSWRKHFNDYNWQKFLSFVENNNICIYSTFFQCVEGWYETYNKGNASYADNTVHELFAVPQISTKTVLRPSGANDAIYIWKQQNNIPVAGRLITRNYVEETYAYQCPSVGITVCYRITLLCSATLVNFYLCRPSFLGVDPNKLFSESIYPAPGIDAVSNYCGIIDFSNPWIVDKSNDMNKWIVSPLVTGSDFSFGTCPLVEVHPHPYVPKELVKCNGKNYMAHLGSASDFNCCATYYFGDSFYFFCYLLNSVRPELSRDFYRELQGCEDLVNAMVPTPSRIGKPLRIGRYYNSSGELQYLNAGAFQSTCCYLNEFFSRAMISTAPDYHQVIGCNVVVGTEDGGALHSKYNGCIIPSLCIQGWNDSLPMIMRWGEFITNANVQVTIKVSITGDKQSFTPSGTYTADLKHTFIGPEKWGLYDADGNRCFDLNPAGDTFDVTNLVEAGGGEVTYNIGAECPQYGSITDPLNLAGAGMFFGNAGFDNVELGNFDNSSELEKNLVILPNAKFINDF